MRCTSSGSLCTFGLTRSRCAPPPKRRRLGSVLTGNVGLGLLDGVCVYVCMCLWSICICFNVCVCLYVCMYVCMHVHAQHFLYVYSRLRPYVRIYIYIDMYVYTMSIYPRTCADIKYRPENVCTYIRIHAYVYKMYLFVRARRGVPPPPSLYIPIYI